NSIAGSVVPRLGSALSSMTSPVALVLDDVHVLRNSEGRAALSVLADHVPRGSKLVLSGQVEPPLRIARLRAEGRVLEIGPGDCRLPAKRHRRCCVRPESCSGSRRWPNSTGGPRDGQWGCT